MQFTFVGIFDRFVIETKLLQPCEVCASKIFSICLSHRNIKIGKRGEGKKIRVITFYQKRQEKKRADKNKGSKSECVSESAEEVSRNRTGMTSISKNGINMSALFSKTTQGIVQNVFLVSKS